MRVARPGAGHRTTVDGVVLMRRPAKTGGVPTLRLAGEIKTPKRRKPRDLTEGCPRPVGALTRGPLRRPSGDNSGQGTACPSA